MSGGREIKRRPPRTPIVQSNNYQLLRQKAFLVFTTDPHVSHPHDLKKQPEFQNVTKPQLSRWAVEDDWLKEKDLVFDRWRGVVVERIGMEIASMRSKELATMAKIVEIADRKLLKETVKASSWEGVFRARIAASERIEQLTEHQAHDLLPGIGSPTKEPALSFSKEETQAAIAAILKTRREAYGPIIDTQSVEHQEENAGKEAEDVPVREEQV